MTVSPAQQAQLDAELVEFAEKGDLDAVTAAVSLGANVAGSFNLALRKAAAAGRDNVVSFLLQNGADVHAQSEEALRKAVHAGKETTVALLLKAGADPNALEGEALILAATRGEQGIARLLLAAKADPHFSDDQALRKAAFGGHAPVVGILLHFRADPFAMRSSAMGLADVEKHGQVVNLLAEAMMEEKNAFLFDLASQPKTQNWLRNVYSDTREAALIRAIKMNCLSKVAERMKECSDVFTPQDLHDMKDRNGQSAIALAAERGHLKMLFDPDFWRGNVAGLKEAWEKLPENLRGQSGVSEGDFQSLVAAHRQGVLKDGASRFKLRMPPGLQ